MSEQPRDHQAQREAEWVTRMGRNQPDLVLAAPFMAYLLLLGLNDQVPEAYMPVAIAIRGIGALAVVWLFRRHFPPLGKAHLGIAIVAGVAVAAGWVVGQKFFSHIGLGGSWIFLDAKNPEDPSAGISTFSWYSQATLRISVACITVPIVEELFWRGFLLRAFISWDHFEKIPLGKFTWFSFLGTSLLSIAQHPDNWGVSVFCWFAYNGLMYWKKSILCLIITHGVTNLALYLYVLWAKDWLFW